MSDRGGFRGHRGRGGHQGHRGGNRGGHGHHSGDRNNYQYGDRKDSGTVIGNWNYNKDLKMSKFFKTIYLLSNQENTYKQDIIRKTKICYSVSKYYTYRATRKI